MRRVNRHTHTNLTEFLCDGTRSLDSETSLVVLLLNSSIYLFTILVFVAHDKSVLSGSATDTTTIKQLNPLCNSFEPPLNLSLVGKGSAYAF